MADWSYDNEVIAALDLVEMDTADGAKRFMLAQDGQFTDTNGNTWIGSTLLTPPKMESAIGGNAPSGELSLTYFQPPGDEDLINQLRSQGNAYVFGREIRFYLQKLCSLQEFYAPTIAPELVFTRTMRTLSFAATGAEDRKIGLTFEPWTEERRAARRIAYNTEGHAQLLGGTANPSLSYMPTTSFQEEKLFG